MSMAAERTEVAAMGAPGTGSLGDRLRAARRRRFVGRNGELELFRRALSSPGDSFTVLFVYGPGGVGKTSLLDTLADAATDSESVLVRLDGRLVQPYPEHVLAAVGGGDDGGELLGAPHGARPVLLVDTYEMFAPLDVWVREKFLTVLPDDVLVVIAGRNPPGPAGPRRSRAAAPDRRRLVRRAPPSGGGALPGTARQRSGIHRPAASRRPGRCPGHDTLPPGRRASLARHVLDGPPAAGVP